MSFQVIVFGPLTFQGKYYVTMELNFSLCIQRGKKKENMGALVFPFFQRAI